MEASPSPQDVTLLLDAWRRGDEKALEALMPAVYSELRRLASRYLSGERRDHTLQTQDLVHEAFLKLVGHRRIDWQSRAHFFAIAASTMRRILVDHARSHGAEKRGGDVRRIVLDESAEPATRPDGDVVAVDEALRALAARDEQLAKIVELRFFGGLKSAEIGTVVGISEATVTRRFRLAKAWLFRFLQDGAPA